jgi:type IV pilus assembly protein PilW
MSMRPLQTSGWNRLRGLTLVELMVAMVLSLVLMLGAIQLFTGSKQTYQLSDALGRVQETGRFALDLLARDIRLGGFTGCIAAPDFSNLLNSTPWQYDFAQPVFGYEGGVSVFPAELTSGSGAAWSAANDPDAIVVLFGDPEQNWVVTGPASPSPSAALEVAPGTALNAGQPMLVTDCSRAALFELSADKAAAATTLAHAAGAGTPETPGNCSDNLHDTCTGGVDVNLLTPYAADVSRALPLRALGYYVANTNRTDAAGNPVPALYRQRLTAAGLQQEELLEGVSDFQVTYGVAPANRRSAEKFVRADEVAAAEWARVVAVRADLTVRAVNDPELMRSFSTTVAVRNRTL